MGLLDNTGVTEIDRLSDLLSFPFGKPKPALAVPDFPGGFEILEYVDGKPQTASRIVLIADQMPMQPFPFGGTQKIVKDYYPGFIEPVVQVLGSRENDVLLHGRLKAKHFRGDQFKRIPIVIQEAMDAMRKRGNLVRLTLGEWTRFGFIEEATFKLYQLSRIEYEIKFTIVGLNPPTNCKFIARTAQVPTADNQALIDQAAAFLAARPIVPHMSKSLADYINGAMNVVAEAMHTVTSLIDLVTGNATGLNTSIARVLGFIRFARNTISNYQRQLGSLSLFFGSYASPYAAGKKVTTSYVLINQILRSQSLAQQLQLILARLERQFRDIAKTLPLARYLVKANDTLQNIAQLFYNNSDLWKNIYDHNHLTTTLLVTGAVLEIPKI